MYERQLADQLRDRAKKYPVVTLTGPRQSGKTTLVRQVFGHLPYSNLEDLDERQLAKDDPRSFLAQFPEGAILDEIQRAPHLLSYIQRIVDEADREGMFILTGSQQLELSETITQSLAGRTALLSLLPMSLAELQSAGIEQTLEESILSGGYPRLYRKQLDPGPTYRDYVLTYIERDLRQLIHVKDLDSFQRFLRLCAGRIGQLLNVASLAGDVGVSAHTIKHWLSILEASFMILRLQPYHENFGKRVVKSPKLYFVDVGVAASVLGIDTAQQVSRDPLYGQLVENLVVLELLKSRLNAGQEPRLYYYRDSSGREVDLIFQRGHELVPIEVKAGRTYNSDFTRNLAYFHSVADARAVDGSVIYAGEKEQRIGEFQLLNFQHAPTALVSDS